MNDIHDIKPPVFAGFDPTILDMLLIAGAVCLLAALIWFLYKLYKRGVFSKKKRNTLLLPPPLPAEDIAEKELKAITPLMKKDRRLFYFKLTAILKKYMSRKFSLNAQEMTSQELSKSLNTLELKSESLRGISKFLNFSDTIKYAAMPASLSEAEKDLSRIKQFIKETSEENQCQPIVQESN